MSLDTALECPKCKKQGFVRLHADSDVFECVYCQHKVDLSEPAKASEKASSFPFVVWIIIALLLVLATGI